MQISPDGEPLTLAVTNGASFAPGIPAPDGLASLFVAGVVDLNPTDLSVSVGGAPAPVLSVTGTPGASQQINFQVPGEAVDFVYPSSSAKGWWVKVQYDGVATVISEPPVGPGIFTSADGAAAVQHAADFSPVNAANPIVAGETIAIYGTGFGVLYPALADGVAATGPTVFPDTGGSSPAVVIGQSACDVIYGGAAPGFVGGYQINCTVRQDVQPGVQPLQISFSPFNITAAPASVTQSNVVMVPVR